MIQNISVNRKCDYDVIKDYYKEEDLSTLLDVMNVADIHLTTTV
jgi:hypothetical protein